MSALDAHLDVSRQKTVLSGRHLWPLDTPAKHEKVSGADVPGRRFWWHRLPACAPHRQDAGATKNFLGQNLKMGWLGPQKRPGWMTPAGSSRMDR
jgi:hypothetical protein